jgi:hypothetical protein
LLAEGAKEKKRNGISGGVRLGRILPHKKFFNLSIDKSREKDYN